MQMASFIVPYSLKLLLFTYFYLFNHWGCTIIAYSNFFNLNWGCVEVFRKGILKVKGENVWKCSHLKFQSINPRVSHSYSISHSVIATCNYIPPCSLTIENTYFCNIRSSSCIPAIQDKSCQAIFFAHLSPHPVNIHSLGTHLYPLPVVVPCLLHSILIIPILKMAELKSKSIDSCPMMHSRYGDTMIITLTIGPKPLFLFSAESLALLTCRSNLLFNPGACTTDIIPWHLSILFSSWALIATSNFLSKNFLRININQEESEKGDNSNEHQFKIQIIDSNGLSNQQYCYHHLDLFTSRLQFFTILSSQLMDKNRIQINQIDFLRFYLYFSFICTTSSLIITSSFTAQTSKASSSITRSYAFILYWISWEFQLIMSVKSYSQVNFPLFNLFTSNSIDYDIFTGKSTKIQSFELNRYEHLYLQIYLLTTIEYLSSFLLAFSKMDLCKLLMFDHYQHSKDCSGIAKDRILGTQQIIIPFQIVKYVLRDGSGDYVQEGMTINCFVNIFLIDGTQISSSKGSKVTKFILGRKRLIKGLEIGLQKIRKNEKLRLIISPEYGYGKDDSISLVPPNSKLIFDIDVINFSFTSIERMSDTDLYFEVYHYLDNSDKLLKKGLEDEGLFALVNAYKYASKIKHYKCTIVGKILLKWANILQVRGDYQNSLLILKRIQKNDNTLEDCLRLYITLYQALDRKEQLQKLIETTYEDNLNDKNIKRVCVNYYKETNNWDRLRKLPGYDHKRDRFVEIKQSEKEKNFGFRMFG